LKPVETNTAGIMLAGACQSAKDIPESVSQASASASKAIALFSNNEMSRDPSVASVNNINCTGCLLCQEVCPYLAIEKEEIKDRAGNVIRYAAKVNSGLCQGCGTCVAMCRNKSIDLQGFSNEQMLGEVMSLLNKPF